MGMTDQEQEKLNQKPAIISSFLPAQETGYEKVTTLNIYSLFIPCTKCNETHWLSFEEKKDRFHFLLLDNDHSRDGKYASVSPETKSILFCKLSDMGVDAYLCRRDKHHSHYKKHHSHYNYYRIKAHGYKASHKKDHSSVYRRENAGCLTDELPL